MAQKGGVNTNKWLIGLLKAVVGIGVILCFSILYSHMQIRAQQTGKIFSTYYVLFLINFIFGLLLGLEHLIQQLSKKGKWSFNLPRILFIGILSLILAFYMPIYYTYVPILIAITNHLPQMLVQSTVCESMAQILLGYILITNFTKSDLHKELN
jgi:predicted neutral ceramidase superfamily lipid hydrolase